MSYLVVPQFGVVAASLPRQVAAKSRLYFELRHCPLPTPVNRVTPRGRQAIPLRLLMKVGRAVVALERCLPERLVLQLFEDCLQFRQ